MKKVSRVLVMALVVLAVITMSLSVNASTQTLHDYVNGIHNINDMVFELTDSQKTAVSKYIATLDNATADAVLNDILAAEKLVANTGATKISRLSASVKSEVIALATSAAAKAGLTLTVNTANNTFTLRTTQGEVLVSGSADALIKYNGEGGAAGGTVGTSTSTGKLLYTGADYAVYAGAFLAIVAVAVVVKKRA